MNCLQFFLADFTFFIHFFLLFGRFGGGVLQRGSGMFPILGLTFLLYCIFFNSALAPLISSNGYQQRGWLAEKDGIDSTGMQY